MNVTVIGTGYVGLVTGTCLSDFGLNVTCVDIDGAKIAKLRQGEIPIYEPGLKELVVKNAAAGRLTFSEDVKGAIPGAEVIFLAVGTPPLHDGSADLSFLFDAVKTISDMHEGYQVVVTKSTVPVGTGAKVEELLSAAHPRESFAVASNPEFLREGCAVSDFMEPDRIVIGCDDAKGLDVLLRLYKPMREQDSPILVTSRVTAELIKYASNAFLAVKITFINEVSRLCESVGADIQQVAKGMGMDPRIGGRFLQPGPGYGGSCFPKDTRALLDVAKLKGVPMKVVDAAVEANEDQIFRALEKITSLLGGLEGKTVGLLGLAFKGDTDDVRESPAVKIARGLLAKGAVVQAFDPAAAENAVREAPGIRVCADPYQAASGADGLVIATEWNAFKNLEWLKLRSVLRSPVVVDLRNLHDPAQVRAHGFTYVSLGRP